MLFRTLHLPSTILHKVQPINATNYKELIVIPLHAIRSFISIDETRTTMNFEIALFSGLI